MKFQAKKNPSIRIKEIWESDNHHNLLLKFHNYNWNHVATQLDIEACRIKFFNFIGVR